MKAILTDVTMCIGCDRCIQACVVENNLGEEKPYRWIREDRLSSERFTTVLFHSGYFVRKHCRHCIDPACVSSCPVSALQKTEEGAVIYDAERCLGCRYCMMACPFGIPRYSWQSPIPYVRKCNMCYTTRIIYGREPACTEACPVHATIFGKREDLLEKARKRIKENPNRYLPMVFGEREVGGTNVLYISPIDLNILSLGNRLDDTPLPKRSEPAMLAVPPVFLGIGASMTFLWWIIRRRMRLSKERKKDEKQTRNQNYGSEKE